MKKQMAVLMAMVMAAVHLPGQGVRRQQRQRLLGLRQRRKQQERRRKKMRQKRKRIRQRRQ